MRLQQYVENDDIITILEMAVIIDQCHRAGELNEGFGESVSDFVKKVKVILKKKAPDISNVVEKDKGLVHYFKDLGVGGAQMMYHAFNAYYNKDAKSKQRVKELAGSIKKEHVIDVLLKLDVLSLHLVTGPLHIIEAVTGWDVMTKIKDKVEPVTKKINHALHALEDLKTDLKGEMKTQLIRYTNGLRRVFDVGGFKHIKEETVTGDVALPDAKIGCGDAVQRRLRKRDKKKFKKKKFNNTK